VHRAPRRDVARSQRDERQDDRDGNESDRVESADPVDYFVTEHWDSRRDHRRPATSRMRGHIRPSSALTHA